MEQAEGDDTFEIASKDLRDAIGPVAEMVGLPFFEITRTSVTTVDADSPSEPPAPPKDEAPPPTPVASTEQPASEPETKRPEKVETPEPAVGATAPTSDIAKESVSPAPSSSDAGLSSGSSGPAAHGHAEAHRHRQAPHRGGRGPAAGGQGQHPTRLFPLIEAIAAEVRMLQERLPMGHDLTDRLGRTLGALNGIRIDGGVQEFVQGLSFNSPRSGGWEHLAYSNRKLVAKYDVDAAEGPPSAKTPKPKPQKADEPETNGQHQWPSLPRLRAMTKPILLAGGIAFPRS